MIIQNYLLDIYYNVFKYELLIYKCKIIIRIIKHIKYKNIYDSNIYFWFKL